MFRAEDVGTPGTNLRACLWCPRIFSAAISGGREKVFCSTSCRRTFHSAARRWAERQFFQGWVSVQELNGHSSTCTLEGRGSEPDLLSTCPSGQASPAGPAPQFEGIGILWATPEGL